MRAMKVVFLAVTVLTAYPAFASDVCHSLHASDPNFKCPVYADECRAVAIEKLLASTNYDHTVLDVTSVRAADIDDRWFRANKSIWFTALVRFPDGFVYPRTVLTQKQTMPEGKCF